MRDSGFTRSFSRSLKHLHKKLIKFWLNLDVIILFIIKQSSEFRYSFGWSLLFLIIVCKKQHFLLLLAAPIAPFLRLLLSFSSSLDFIDKNYKSFPIAHINSNKPKSNTSSTWIYSSFLLQFMSMVNVLLAT